MSDNLPFKLAKGWREIRKEPSLTHDGVLSLENIKQRLEGIFEDLKRKNPPKVIMYQGCKTYGIVERSNYDLNICPDPTCPSCSMLRETLLKETQRIGTEYDPDFGKSTTT